MRLFISRLITPSTPRLRMGLSAFLLLAAILQPAVTARAQSATDAAALTSVSYPSAVLTDLNDDVNLKDNIYVVPDSSGNITRSTLRDMITRGYLMKYRSDAPTINLGSSGVATWVVFPVSSISNSENWAFHLGYPSQGRFSLLKQFELYDLNRGKTLFSSQTDQSQNVTIPEKFNVNIPPGQIVFLAAYIKSSPANLTILSPRFENQSDPGLDDINQDKIFIYICAGLILTLLVTARRNWNISYLYAALMWGVILFHAVLVNNFTFQRVINTDFLTPATYVSASILLLIASWKSLGYVEKKPMPLYLGLAGILLIAGMASVVLSKAMPSFSLSLSYGVPAVIGFVIANFTIQRSSKSSRYLSIALAGSAVFLSLSNIMILLLASHFVPATEMTVLTPCLLTTLAAVFSYLVIMDGQTTYQPAAPKIKKADKMNLADNAPKEDSDLKNAREKSEHRRLMQVIEQERKAMSEMQIRAAQQTEEMRKAKESADEATRAKSAFLAVVSHEIRTPMTGVMGMLRLLQDTTLTKEQADYASTIKDSGDALLALLNDILDFEKIESGKMELESISFDLKRLLRGIQTLMKGHAEFKNVDLVLEMDAGLPQWVIGDPTRLRQVLLNLINNAIKFTTKGAVTLRVQDLAGKSPEDYHIHSIYFAVQDSGIGISLDAQKKLFMPFAQADSSVSRKYGGTGLGLAICKRLIEAMNGNINISSKENEGSTFFFTLKMEEGSETRETKSTESISEAHTDVPQDIFFHHQLKMLVVDDNMINLKVVSGFMDKLGIDMATASSGKDVLDMIEREQFSAILMDLQLPDMNGIEITKHIRDNRNPVIAHTPVIAFTGNTAQEDIDACQSAGMNDFASKPISFEKIVELLRKADGQISFRWTLEDKKVVENDDDISPLMRHSMMQEANNLAAQPEHMKFSDPDFLSIDLDEDDDSFSVAVKKFEEMENATPAPAERKVGTLAEYGLDEAILKSLVGGLGAGPTKEILVSFYEKCDELISEIGKAFLDGNLPSLYARSHELKGMAANFGFSDLSNLCTAIEKAAKNSEPSSSKGEIESLGETYSIARSYLQNWLDAQI